MEKIALKNSDIKPDFKSNVLILLDDEIITKMCDVYKLDLTEEQKAKHYLSYLRNNELFSPTSVEGLKKLPLWEEVKNSDFYVFRVKEEFRKTLKTRKSVWKNDYGKYWFSFNTEEFTLLYNSSIDRELEPVSGPLDLFDFISDYLRYQIGYSGNELICESGITQVRLIRNFNRIFE